MFAQEDAGRKFNIDPRGVTTRWIKPEGKLTWNFDVAKGGAFDVVLVTTETRVAKGGDSMEGGHVVKVSVAGNELTGKIEKRRARLECAQSALEGYAHHGRPREVERWQRVAQLAAPNRSARRTALASRCARWSWCRRSKRPEELRRHARGGVLLYPFVSGRAQALAFVRHPGRAARSHPQAPRRSPAQRARLAAQPPAQRPRAPRRWARPRP